MTSIRVRRRSGREMRSGAFLAGSIGLMNLSTYGFTMVAARWLGPRGYGAFAALMGLLLVLGVLQLGLQATAARRIAADPGDTAAIRHTMLAIGTRSGLVLGALCLAATPLLDRTLRLHDPAAAAMVALAVVPMTVMGAQAGVLQGQRRWRALGWVYLANGLPRLGLGSALLAWHPAELTAMVAVVLGQWAPVLVGRAALGRSVAARAASAGSGSVLGEIAHSSHALLAFLALCNVDILVARSVLDGHGAGLYAAGLILVKGVLFLPQFVVVIAFPSMTSEHTRRRTLLGGLAAVALIGLGCTLGARWLSRLALVFVGGGDYAAVQHHLWQFAIVGTVLSMLQLLVYSVLARRARRSVLLVWAALLAIAVGGRFVTSWSWLLALVLTTDAVLFVLLLGLSLWRLRRSTGPARPGNLSGPRRTSSARFRPRRPAGR